MRVAKIRRAKREYVRLKRAIQPRREYIFSRSASIHCNNRLVAYRDFAPTQSCGMSMSIDSGGVENVGSARARSTSLMFEVAVKKNEDPPGRKETEKVRGASGMVRVVKKASFASSVTPLNTWKGELPRTTNFYKQGYASNFCVVKAKGKYRAIEGWDVGQSTRQINQDTYILAENLTSSDADTMVASELKAEDELMIEKTSELVEHIMHAMTTGDEIALATGDDAKITLQKTCQHWDPSDNSKYKGPDLPFVEEVEPTSYIKIFESCFECCEWHFNGCKFVTEDGNEEDFWKLTRFETNKTNNLLSFFDFLSLTEPPSRPGAWAPDSEFLPLQEHGIVEEDGDNYLLWIKRGLLSVKEGKFTEADFLATVAT